MNRVDGEGWRRIRPRSVARFSGIAGVGSVLLIAMGSAAKADVTPATGIQSLGTQVSQSCSSTCLLSITGGTGSGNNLFHRFQSFDTRSNGGSGPIGAATFQNGTFANVIVGVLNPTFIGVPVGLQNAANLFWLSPGGITIGGQGSFTNVTNLTLSTATGLKLGSGAQQFDAIQTTADQAATLSGTPVPGRSGLVTDLSSLAQLSRSSNGDIVLQDGLLTVDTSLLLDAQQGNTLLNGTSVVADTGAGGDVEIAGSSVRISSTEPLTAVASIDLSASSGGLAITGDGGGVRLAGANVTTGSGGISIRGTGVSTTSGDATGVSIVASTISSGTGTITITGTGGSADLGADGLSIAASSISSGGNLALSGVAGTTTGTGSGPSPAAVRIPDSCTTGLCQTISAGSGLSISSSGDPVRLGGTVNADGPVVFPGVTQLELGYSDSGFDGSVVFSGTGLVTLPTTGTTTMVGNGYASSLALTGGTLSGDGGLTISGNSLWTGGRLTGSGSLDIEPTATLTLSGGTKELGSRTINNAGTITWTSGDLQQISDSVINNSGLIDIQGDGLRLGNSTHPLGNSSFTTTINNLPLGTLQNSAGWAVLGTGAWWNGSSNQFGYVNLNNDGLVDVRSSLTLTGSPTTATHSSGIFRTTSTPGGISPRLFLDFGTFNLSNGAVIEAISDLDGTPATGRTVLNGSGAVLNLTGTDAPGSEPGLASPTAAGLEIVAGTLTGPGDLTISGDALWTGGTLTGSGSLTIDPSATLTIAEGGRPKDLGNRTINNNGTIYWIGGNIQQIGNSEINNNGLIDIRGDVSLGNNTRRNDNSSFTTTINNSPLGTLQRRSGSGDAALGSGSWSGGIAQFGYVNLNNDGLVDVQSGNLTLIGSPTTATDSSGIFRTTSTPGISPRLTLAAGTFNLLNGAGIEAISDLDGEPATGRTYLSGATLNITGTDAPGSEPGLAPPTAAGFEIAAGTLTGPGTLSIQSRSYSPGNQYAIWSGGTITGSGNLSVETGSLFRMTGGVKDFGDRTISINDSAVALWESGDIQQVGNGVINNSGLLRITGALTLGNTTRPIPNSSYTTIINNNTQGVLQHTGSGSALLGSGSLSGGISQFGYVDLTNNGLIDVSSGGINSGAGNFSQLGSIDVKSGASFIRSAGFTNAGVLSGNGRIVAGNLINAGWIRPGGAGTAGTLTIQGNLSSTSTGVLEIELANGSIGGGSQHDVLAITGTAALAGGLNAVETSPSSVGQSFDIVTATAMTGGFDPDSSSLPPGINGAIVGGGTTYRLTQSGIFCTGTCWDGGAGTSDWAAADNWSGNQLPGSSDRVFLNLVDGAAITLASEQTVASLFSTGDNNLTILDGGALNLIASSATSQLNGALSIEAGGALSSAGNLTIRGSFNQSGGALSGARDITIAPLTGSVSIDGGTISASGNLIIQPLTGAVTVSNASLSGRGLAIFGKGEAMLPNGIDITGSTLSAGVAGLSLGGTAVPETVMDSGDDSFGVRIDQSSHLSSAGPLSISGTGGSAAGRSTGVAVLDSTIAASGITGIEGTGGSGLQSSGIWLDSAVISSGGSLELGGSGGTATNPFADFNEGILITNTNLTSATGLLSITGTGASYSGSSSWLARRRGVLVQGTLTSGGGISVIGDGSSGAEAGAAPSDGVLLQSSGLNASGGAITITGRGGPGGMAGELTSDGVILSGTNINASSGPITITGSGDGGSQGAGISVNTGSSIQSGTAPISLTSSRGDLIVTGNSSIQGAGSVQLDSSEAIAVQGSTLTSPGGTIRLTAAAGGIDLTDATLTSRGSSKGGTIILQGTSTAASASAVSINNSTLRTSATATTPATTGGTITINGVPTETEATPQAAGVTITDSLIEADPPGTGGAITINANTILVQGTTLNVLGFQGGALDVGSLVTTNLNLDSASTLILGPDARQTFLVAPGGILINNARIEYPLGAPGSGSSGGDPPPTGPVTPVDPTPPGPVTPVDPTPPGPVDPTPPIPDPPVVQPPVVEPPGGGSTSGGGTSGGPTPQGGSSNPDPATAQLAKSAVAALDSVSQPPFPANNGSTATPSGTILPGPGGPGIVSGAPVTALAALELDASVGFSSQISTSSPAGAATPGFPTGAGSAGLPTGAGTAGTRNGAAGAPGSGAAVTMSMLSGDQARASFLDAEAKAQRTTAEKLGLADASATEPPTPERLQGVMQSVQAWLKERERLRRCRKDPTNTCRP